MVDEAGVSDGWIKGVLCDKHRYCEYRYGDEYRKRTVTVEE